MKNIKIKTFYFDLDTDVDGTVNEFMQNKKVVDINIITDTMDGLIVAVTYQENNENDKK